MATHSSILPGEPHGQRSLVGYSPRGHKESDATEQLSTAQHNHDAGTVLAGQDDPAGLHLVKMRLSQGSLVPWFCP